jgi:CAAX amino terminal protease family.
MKEKTPFSQKVLNLWGIILIVWAFYRLKFKMPEWFDEFMAKPIIFILPVYYFVKKSEKKSFLPSLNWSFKTVKKDFLIAIFIGLVIFLTIVLANYFRNKEVVFLKYKISYLSFFYIIFVSLITAISEQILSTGFVLKRLYEETKNFYQSAFFNAILFFFLHVPLRFTIPGLMGNQLIFLMMTDVFLSLLNSYFYLTYKSLNLPIFIHAFYNIIIALIA